VPSLLRVSRISEIGNIINIMVNALLASCVYIWLNDSYEIIKRILFCMVVKLGH
jgi:uncharacterized membrane protein